MSVIITGIGSRSIPVASPDDKAVAPWLLEAVSEIGDMAKANGWILRSGGADGMDSLFEYVWGDQKEIFIPWQGFSNRYRTNPGVCLIEDEAILAKAQSIVSKVHPAWSRLGRGAKALHTRNVFQALGPHLDQPSDLCIYWAKVNSLTGEVQGGTRSAVEICKQYGTPTYNLNVPDDRVALRQHLNELLIDDCTIRTVEF